MKCKLYRRAYYYCYCYYFLTCFTFDDGHDEGDWFLSFCNRQKKNEINVSWSIYNILKYIRYILYNALYTRVWCLPTHIVCIRKTRNRNFIVISEVHKNRIKYVYDNMCVCLCVCICTFVYATIVFHEG